MSDSNNRKNFAEDEKMNALISACKKNNRVAQIQIYDLYSKTMYNTCLRIVKDTMLAEDIVQESFLAAFRSIDSYRGESSFVSWLRKIVINKSLDQVRKRKQFFEQFNEEYENYSDTAEIEDGNSETNRERLSLLKKLILDLPDGFRVIVSLYYFEGYDHDEIGQILNITASTSRSQLTRAKKKLLKLYNEHMDSV